MIPLDMSSKLKRNAYEITIPVMLTIVYNHDFLKNTHASKTC